MDAIALMMEEHKHIKRMLKVVRKLCIKILNGEEVNYNGFAMAIDFIRNYADKHHHNKEEEILFSKMSEELGEHVKSGPIFGMLAEHDLGRLYIANLETALEKAKQGDHEAKVDIIANAISYTDLLHRHIDKEDTAIYVYGRKQLSSKAMEDVEERCRAVEKNAEKADIQRKYVGIVEQLEEIANH
ncbi:MAG: hemerythrin domain-containing protein [Bacillota bacterium]